MGFVANDKWRQAPGFELLRHICASKLTFFTVTIWQYTADSIPRV